jgi:hypothetical protein
MTPRTLTSHDRIRSMIARVRRRWMLQVRLRAAGVAMTAGAMPLVLALLCVYAARPAGAPFLVLMAAAVVLAIVGAAVPIVRMRKRPADRRVARYIEERLAALTGDASLNDGLVSALDVADSSAAQQTRFGDLLLERASRQLSAAGPSEIISPKSLRTGAWMAAVGAAFLLSALTMSAPALIRAGDVARVTFFPGAIHVDVLPGNVRLAAGTPLRVRSVIRGGERALSQVSPVLTIVARGERKSVVMKPASEAFEYSIPAIDRTFSYSVSAGTARSADYTVTALFPPRVTRIDLSYVYPSFSGLSPREEQDGGDIYAPAGTRVRLRIHADKPVARGELTFGRGPAVAVRAVAEGVVEADVVLAADDSYRVQLADRDSLQSKGESEYFIRLMNDRPPDVRVLRPSSDQQITPLEEIAVEARADDDYGIAAFDLVYAVGGGTERTLSFERVTGTPVERVGTTLLSAEALGVKPGDVISYYARARDVGRGKRSMQATSDIFFLEVKPFSEEFVSAQSQAGGQGGAQIDGLVEAQKQIIASTWNIERRSTGGRSADDIKSVAEAQAALKARAQQMSSRGSRRFGSMPQRVTTQGPQPVPLSDPIAAAILAMDKAVEQLQTDRTKDALPHEMAALNGLLQAQAEVRRREVARQQANGSGNSGNRAGQDMSALFDKELQRQQQTNYETQASVESRADHAESDDSLLDRIRDLARRQEDLSRRQRELGQSSPDADELRRQLETLTREQTTLREEAEELSKRRGSQGSQSSPQNGRRSQAGTSDGRSSGESSDKAGGQSLRDAVEQMRAAASDLNRKDASTAARNGSRAAEQLRRFESQTRAGTSGSNQGARSDLQMEGQQIAQEQRRIAAEAERLDRSAGAAATDARKRLADEKGRLAQRVEELRGAVARSAAASKRPSDSVARELGGVGQRMRDSAQQMRDAPSGQSTLAKGEQGLARSLERIAGQLNAGVSPEAQQLSAELDEMHAIRDRLQRLEQQMRDAAPEDGPSPEPSQRSSGRGGQGDGAGGGRGGSSRTNEAQRLQEEYRRELERSRQALERLSGGQQPTGGQNGGTPTGEQFSRSAPGTEAFKQDRSAWESLRKALDLALDQHEAAVSSRLTRKAAEDRFSAGGSERVPEGYQPLISRYFESLASAKKAKNP